MSRTALALIALAALLGFWGLGAHNRLVRLRQAIVQSWVAVDVQLQRRHALARELAERLAVPEAQPAVGDELARSAVQMLAAAVRQAETAAVQARTRAAHAGTIQSLAMAEQVLDNALRPLALLIHARSRRLQRAGLHQVLRELLQREPEIETQAVFARRLFNAAVADFNRAINELPTRLLAGPMRFVAAAGFQAERPEGAWLAPLPPVAALPAPAAATEVLALPVVEMSARPVAAVPGEAGGPTVGTPQAEDATGSARGSAPVAAIEPAASSSAGAPTAMTEASASTPPAGLAATTTVGAEAPTFSWPASTIDLSDQAMKAHLEARGADAGPVAPPAR